METNKFKWTRVQNEIFRFLCIKSGSSVNQRFIAEKLKVSPTAVAKALKSISKERLIIYSKDPRMNLTYAELNRDNEKAISFKRVENLKMIYESGLLELLNDKFPGTLIILFGSYSYGTDIINSDVDIAIIGSKKKEINLGEFEKLLGRKIIVQFYDSLKEIYKNLRNNIINGIILKGVIEL